MARDGLKPNVSLGGKVFRIKAGCVATRGGVVHHVGVGGGQVYDRVPLRRPPRRTKRQGSAIELPGSGKEWPVPAKR